MDNINSLAHDCTCQLGIAPSLEGFDRFMQAVVAFASAPVQPKYNAVCRKIAGTLSTKDTVEKGIHYALTTIKDFIIEKLLEITGKPVNADDIHILKTLSAASPITLSTNLVLSPMLSWL